LPNEIVISGRVVDDAKHFIEIAPVVFAAVGLLAPAI